MENASKALIIAGAIVLSVLIVSLGFYFFNQSSGVGKSFNMTEYDIKSHNSKFEAYEGMITGAQARELYDKVYQYNLSQGDGLGIILTNQDQFSYTTESKKVIFSYDLTLLNKVDMQTGAKANEFMLSNSCTIKKQDLILGKYYNVSTYKSSKLGTIAVIKISEN